MCKLYLRTLYKFLIGLCRVQYLLLVQKAQAQPCGIGLAGRRATTSIDTLKPGLFVCLGMSTLEAIRARLHGAL